MWGPWRPLCRPLCIIFQILFIPWHAAALRPAADRAHTVVHITDPQLGMLNMYKTPRDWTAEQTMLTELAQQAAGLAPDLVFVGGDMQNWWPNEKDPDRNKVQGMTEAQFEDLKKEDLGRQQREAVRDAMQSLQDFPVFYTAGNHDVGDYPDDATLKQYTSGTGSWGPLFQRVKKSDGVLYLQFNSQVYWSNDASLEVYREKQLAFLQAEMENVAGIQRLVLLTHIPPFMDSVDEGEGWANWKKSYRTQILDVFASTKVPMLWICGHFHANVEKESTYQGVGLSIRVSSAAGTTMQWKGKDDLPSKEARSVASKDVAKAFQEDIGFDKITKRLRAQGDRSGLRIFRIGGDSFYDRWFTLDELRSNKALEWLR